MTAAFADACNLISSTLSSPGYHRISSFDERVAGSQEPIGDEGRPRSPFPASVRLFPSALVLLLHWRAPGSGSHARFLADLTTALLRCSPPRRDSSSRRTTRGLNQLSTLTTFLPSPQEQCKPALPPELHPASVNVACGRSEKPNAVAGCSFVDIQRVQQVRTLSGRIAWDGDFYAWRTTTTRRSRV